MNKRETVQVLMDSIQKGEFELAKSMLADDFQFSGSVPEPLNKDAWLEMSINLKSAFPNLNYHFKMIGTDGDVVRSTTQISGTQTGTLNLVNMNMGSTPATNKSVSAKTAKTRITIKKDKITLWAVEPTEGADLTDILSQLGVKHSGH
ncbi:MAG: ester cyclase [Anaerolineales bacterium]|jgi:predicted ester cyclase|uniref:ester cyclase n=1 Tax=Candidatus Villigracilis vicinus TaxID=3140679 RepID=UPI0031354D22|nr:ester cyclase [Anaerolineales bacterium]